MERRYSSGIPGPEGGEAAPSRPAAANKGRRFPPETLTEVEVSALIRAASGRAPTRVRNRALIVVLYRGGLRVFEALALQVRDVDVDAGTIRVRHGKGDRSRIVGIDPARGVADRPLAGGAQGARDPALGAVVLHARRPGAA